MFKTYCQLTTHQNIHRNVKVTCEVCQKQFASKSYLKRHWNSKHQQTHGLFENKRSKYCLPEAIWKLINFFLTVGVVCRTGSFSCDHCGAKLLNRRYFYTHYLQHHQSATMLCDLCPQSFNQKHRLVRHFRNSHLNLRFYKCKLCRYKGLSKDSLKNHMRQHESKAECKVCHKLVANMYQHLRTHAEVKCPICSKTYSKKTISEHLKVHARKIKTET